MRWAEVVAVVGVHPVVMEEPVGRRQCLINFNFLFQSLTRDISYSVENLAIDSLLR